MGKVEDLICTNLEQIRRLCQQLLELADAGDRVREDVGCGVVYGHVRDCAYKLLRLTERELGEHGVQEPRVTDREANRPIREREVEES